MNTEETTENEEDFSKTDNPVNEGETVAELAAGDSFEILAKYTYHGNWWYIECTVDGKTARGFIDREKSSFCSGGEAGQTPVTLGTLGIPGMSLRSFLPTGIQRIRRRPVLSPALSLK